MSQDTPPPGVLPYLLGIVRMAREHHDGTTAGPHVTAEAVLGPCWCGESRSAVHQAQPKPLKMGGSLPKDGLMLAAY